MSWCLYVVSISVQVIPVEVDSSSSQSGSSDLRPVPFGPYHSPLLAFRSYRYISSLASSMILTPSRIGTCPTMSPLHTSKTQRTIRTSPDVDRTHMGHETRVTDEHISYGLFLRFSPYYRTKEKLSLTSVTYSNTIEARTSFCRFDLTGTCNDDECRW